MTSTSTLKEKFKKHRALVPFVIPAMLFALVFSYLPMIGILIAFKDNPNFGRYRRDRGVHPRQLDAG